MSLDRKYLLCAMVYIAIGMGLGVYMGASGDHGQLITHAHILLVGFVVSLSYAIIHRLWLAPAGSGIASAQFYVHQAGTAVLVVGLFLLYGQFAAEPTVGPVLGIASVVVLVGALLMGYMVMKTDPVRA
jgi:hypothetical protein